MKNISFDNPYWLLIFIPIALAVVIPFIISINKDNRTIGWKLSLGIHLLIAALIALAAAGLSSVSVLTRTNVFVLADVSDSSERNLERIDGYIADISESLPVNSRLGVVCFGKSYEMLTPLGRDIVSVSESSVDGSVTDIAAALSYTADQFRDGSIKRIVLITDGNDTAGNSESDLAATVARLTENGIKVDAIFLDSSLAEGECEVQLSGVSNERTAYLGGVSEADILLQSSGSTNALVELFARRSGDGDYKSVGKTVAVVDSGFTSVKLALPTAESGDFEYLVTVSADEDISEKNNEYRFTQTVVGKTKILHVTGLSADVDAIALTYGNDAEIDSFVVGGGARVPFTVEELVVYDEIVISNLDIRTVNNANAFVDSLDTVVSQYGKSLVTIGDLSVQTDKDDMLFNKFSEMLPVQYGSAGRDGRLYTIVLDVSHSMFMAYKFTIAKEAAIKLLTLLDDNDYVSLVTFSGSIKVHAPDLVRNCRSELVEYIDSLTTSHGTDIGLGLEEALKTVESLNMTENQVMLISDGFSFDNKVNALEVAEDLFAAGVPVSSINTYVSSDGEGGRAMLRSITSAGEGGNYYEISTPERVEDVVFGSVSNEVTQAIVSARSSVNIERYKDSAVKGFDSFSDVSVFIQSIKKYDATVPLTINYSTAGGYTKEVPLYAYRSHGNGRVSSLTTSFTGGWTGEWSADEKSAFLGNILSANTPKSRTDHPFSVELEYNDYDAYISIVPGILDPAAVTKLEIRYPDGIKRSATLSFDGQKYSYTFETKKVGAYSVTVTYTYGEHTYTARYDFDLPYLPEHNAFASFDKSVVYGFMRGNGSITEGEIPNLENDKNEVSTYKRSYAIPLMIAAVSLFIVDIVVRKFRINKKRQKRRGA